MAGIPGTSDNMTTPARWHLGSLDALRGIAVLGVVLVHSAGLMGTEIPLPAAIRNVAFSGARGVALFFLVSAFTLFLSHDNRKDEQSPTRNFFIRRFFRLAPMFYLANLLPCLLVRTALVGPKVILLSLLFINGLSPATIHSGAIGGWSVTDEAIFYFSLPFLFFKIKSLKEAVIWLLAGTGIAFVYVHLLSRIYPQYWDYFAYYSFPAQSPAFLMGITAYFLWKEIRIDDKKAISALLLFAAALFYVALLPFTFRNFYPTSLVCFLLLLALSFHPWRVLVNSVTGFLGKISYSIYLLHFFPCYYLHHTVDRFSSSPLVQFLLCFFGTLLVAVPLSYVTWRWIEEPGRRLGLRLIAKLGEKESVLVS
jgi:peptidoglycan/LPS O-acetylase OafA/YrhL